MIHSIRLKDCQLWEDVTLKFDSDKPNFLVGKNNSAGKSVLMKMLMITACPTLFGKEEREGLIRYGASYAMLACGFTDGSIGMTLVYPERVLWRYKLAGATEFVTYSAPPTDYINALGLLVSESNDYIYNLIDTDQDLFLIQSCKKNNVALLKMLAEEPNIREVLGKIKVNVTSLTEAQANLRIKGVTLKSNLEQHTYVDISGLETEVVQLREAGDLLDRLIPIYEILPDTSDLDTTDYNEGLKLLAVLSQLRDLADSLPEKPVVKDYDIAMCEFAVLQRLKVLASDLPEKPELQDFSVLQDLKLYQILLELHQSAPTEAVTQEVFADCDKGLLELNLLQSLVILEDLLNIITTSVIVIEDAKTVITETLTELDTAGVLVQCPVKGEVIYANEKCIPCS